MDLVFNLQTLRKGMFLCLPYTNGTQVYWPFQVAQQSRTSTNIVTMAT